MTTGWDELVTLARELEDARRKGAAIDPEKARRLARAVIARKDAPPGEQEALRRPARDSS